MRPVKALAKLLVSAGLFWVIARSVDFGAVLHMLGMVHAGLLAAALAALLLQVVVLAWRWAMVTKILGHGLDWASLLRMTFVGQFFNQALPSSVGGDAVRIWMARKAGAGLRQSVHGVIADRAVATAMLLVFVLAGMPLQGPILGDSVARWTADGLALGCLVGFALCLALAAPVRRRLGHVRLVREAADLALAVRRIVSDRRHAPAVLLLSALNHVLAILGMLLLAMSLGLPAAVPAFFVLVPLVLLLSMIPISIGGWGLREGIMIAAFGHVGLSSEQALGLSLLFGLAITAVSLPGGAVWLLERRAGAGAQPTTFPRAAPLA
jgi:uncharacterized membrane protein YbhN (UPF0104 family)